MPNPEEHKPQTEAGLSFKKWATLRPALTQKDLLDIWAGLHGLRYAGTSPVSRPKKGGGQSFANWIRSRNKLTKAEIFDIESQLKEFSEIQP